eukprot:scaffold1410_cov386-Prasinococcus_capsulatus_cf.AAC.21
MRPVDSEPSRRLRANHTQENLQSTVIVHQHAAVSKGRRTASTGAVKFYRGRHSGGPGGADGHPSSSETINRSYCVGCTFRQARVSLGGPGPRC